MAEIVTKIILDVSQKNVFDYILAKQGDKASRFLEIELQNMKTKIEIEPTAKVYLNAEKSDKHVTRTEGTVLENGNVKVGLTNQTLAVDGLVICDVTISNGISTLTTLQFTIKVENSTASDDVIISTDEFTQLDKMVERVDTLESDITTAEADRKRNETARQTAEIQREENNNEVRELIDNFAGDMVIANNVTPGAVKAGGDISVNSSGVVSVVASLKLEIVKMDNPVGTIRYFAVSTNPSSLLGFGTWEQIAKGRAIVGVNTSDTDFSTVGKIGGAKNHTLTIAEMPSHSHKGSVPNTLPNTATGSQTYGYILDGSYRTTETAGDGQAHNNLQPYECYYIWKRTA